MKCETVGEYTGEVKCIQCPISEACMQAAMAWDDYLDELAGRQSELEELVACYEHEWKGDR